MNRDKQIEEMAKEIQSVSEPIRMGMITVGEKGVGITLSEKIAKHLIENKGYRKASDVAREIFEEIEKSYVRYVLNKTMEGSVHSVTEFVKGCIAELKKKYTEGEKCQEY